VQTNIYRTSSLETKIRSATKEAIQEIKSCEAVCGCNRKMMGAITTCRNCLMREVSMRLQKAGFNSAICKTKWRTSSDIPSGTCYSFTNKYIFNCIFHCLICCLYIKSNSLYEKQSCGGSNKIGFQQYITLSLFTHLKIK